MPEVRSDYLHDALDPSKLADIVHEATKFLSRRRDRFDGIVVRGVSGMLVGTIVAYKMKVPLLIVRKKDGSHSKMSIEGSDRISRYVIIDDFIDSGATMRKIIKEVGRFNKAALSGIVLYSSTPDMVHDDFSKKHHCWIKQVYKHHNLYK